VIVTKYNTEKWLILAGVWFLYMGFGLSMTSLAPLVADIENELNLTHDQMGQIMGAWQFVYIFAAIPCGLFLDKIGTRWGIAIGALIIGISGLSRGFSDNYYELLFSVSPKKKYLLKKKKIKNIKCIGYFQKGSGLVIRDENKKIIKFNNDGFSHF